VRWELPKTVRRRAADSVCPEPPHPEERACASAAANQVARARVSKDGAAQMPRDGGSFGDERRVLSRLILRSAHAGRLPQIRSRVRASRRMRTAVHPSCFETAARSATSGELGRPHPEERACRRAFANSNGRARASRRMRTAVPPHASRRRLRRLLSMRESQHEGITIARAGHHRAKQGCGFFLFSSCSGLISAARRADQRSAGDAHFRF